jgi:hypothetical protein
MHQKLLFPSPVCESGVSFPGACRDSRHGLLLQERYEPFAFDFGPVNLYVVNAFVTEMRKYWNCPELRSRELVYYCVSYPMHTIHSARHVTLHGTQSFGLAQGA